MLKRLTVRNFRSLVDVEVPLCPLTVLIGNNDSGKSTFLRAVDLVANQKPFEEADRHRNDKAREWQILGTLVGGNTIDLQKGRSNPNPAISPAQAFQLPAQGVSMISAGYNDEAGAQALQPDGSGVPGLLDFLLRRDRRRFSKVIEEVESQVPGLTDIEIVTPQPHQRRLDLVLESGFKMPADQASSGVRLLLFFIALTYHPSPPKVILLEEPETGLHPKRLAEVITLLRLITQGKHGGHPAQVILTTHSPYLLDCVNLDSDQVLVFRRNADGSRTAEPADKERLDLFLDEFQLGEVWYNEGEEALIKK